MRQYGMICRDALRMTNAETVLQREASNDKAAKTIAKDTKLRIQDPGPVLRILMARLSGRSDGNLVNRIIR